MVSTVYQVFCGLLKTNIFIFKIMSACGVFFLKYGPPVSLPLPHRSYASMISCCSTWEREGKGGCCIGDGPNWPALFYRRCGSGASEQVADISPEWDSCMGLSGTPETKHLFSHLRLLSLPLPKRTGIVTGLYQSKAAKLIGASLILPCHSS